MASLTVICRCSSRERLSQEQASNNAAYFASLGILADLNLQSNMLFCKNFQAASGPRPRITKQEVSIDVL
jgi:hypothetical protein